MPWMGEGTQMALKTLGNKSIGNVVFILRYNCTNNTKGLRSRLSMIPGNDHKVTFKKCYTTFQIVKIDLKHTGFLA